MEIIEAGTTIRLLVTYVPKDRVIASDDNGFTFLDGIADAIAKAGGAVYNSTRVNLLNHAEHRTVLRQQALSKLSTEERDALGIEP